MKKLFLFISGILVLVACGPKTPVSVISVVITPPGDTAAITLTAGIKTRGEGIIRVEWSIARYDSVSVVKTEEIEVDTEGTYASVLSSELGWYWVDVFGIGDSLLWHTDSVFCGPDSTLTQIDFSADVNSGSTPLVVTFTNNTRKETYTRWLWDFGDGATSGEWEPVHTYQNAGKYQAKLTVSTPAGVSKDSLTINVFEPLEVTSVKITPPGSTTKTKLTAEIDATGQGGLRVEWLNACYDSVSVVKSEEIEVDTEGTYASVLSSELGWYWVDVFDAGNALLWHTDSVFCGPDTALPDPAFAPDWEYGPHPLTVTFFIKDDQDEYTWAFWDFADGYTSTDWQPVHTYDAPGQYRATLKLRNLAGSAQDSTLIYVW